MGTGELGGGKGQDKGRSLDIKYRSDMELTRRGGIRMGLAEPVLC